MLKMDCFEEYYKKSDKFRLLILSNEYKKIKLFLCLTFSKKLFFWALKLILENGKECKVPQGSATVSYRIISYGTVPYRTVLQRNLNGTLSL